MRVQLAAVSKRYGAQIVLDRVDLTIGPRARLGIVGPNGVGKTTLLRILAGLEEPDAGSVVRAPAWLTSGYLAQERLSEHESLLATLARRTGVADAERELLEASAALASDANGAGHAGDRYSVALERFLSLGGADFEARARTICAELGLEVELGRSAATLSGGERARAALAATLLSRYDLLLLDEPTNDLDLDGLARLERFLDSYAGALVVVSHDRELLDRTATRIVDVEPSTRRVREWAGTWSDYAAARETQRLAAVARYEQADTRRRRVASLLAKRRDEARGHGDSLGKTTGGADRRATQALRTKVRQAERLLERNELPEKPFEPWELRLTLAAGERPGDLVARLDDAVAVRGDFRLGPLSLDLVAGERLAVTGRNGSGKTTLLGMLVGETPLVEGRRSIGRRTHIGSLAQRREAYAESTPLVSAFRSRTGLALEPARTLLAKFGLGADHVGRSCSSLSPGERTRAQLAEIQFLRVNLLVLDEPTNHLDIEAVEQLEAALAGYDGTIVVVSHDRRFLERIAPTRELGLDRLEM
ncbi:MAG: ABC-F family ATP-binding cassette domain-containing protein [Actinobacteria bacterium]|nr:ABC-F family ATP-binding cassette domain-containing protein [Actinomycetota bacterium]